MIKKIAAFFALALLPILAFGQANESSTLPFSVSVGGAKARVIGADAVFATLEKPVAPDAPIELGTKGTEMAIINVVAADEKGTPKEGAIPAIIVIQSGTKTSLDKTMDGKKLTPGNYLMAVVAEGKTASVSLKVQ
ncbi:MAG TPA: hypothetical protein VF551_08530 [Chthoniobacterales bacterium]|jgi:hypothetical protein